jgi:beta-glucuronidase
MTASNALDHLHDERYGAAFDPRNFDHRGMVFTGGRRLESLDGVWRFTPDLFEEGMRQHWYRLDGGARARTAPWDGDPDSGYAMPVPSCWNLARAEWRHFEGSAWYSRRFAYRPRDKGERVFVRIGAANYDTKVFLNGRFLGNHVGGSTPFFVELTGQLVARNRLDLCVNNARSATRVPMHHFDWFNYGGVYREVALLRVPGVFIRDLVVQLAPDGILVSAELSDRTESGTGSFRVPELGIAAELRFRKGQARKLLRAEPELWSPARPKLYDVTLSYGADRVADRIGFRRVETRGHEILLNGAAIKLRGICVHEDDLTLGKTTNEADLRRRFRHARELGCNFLRLTHYPHHELAAKLADELGFLLWEEIPVYWAIAFDDKRTYRDAENQLLELIKRDRNRASVILWSVGNENADTDARLRFMARLARTARRHDPTRLVSAACLVNKKEKRIEDRLTDELDVIGINEYYGWYDPNPSDLIAIGRNSRIGKPVVITETGAEAPAGRRGHRDELFTEDKMVAFYRAQVAAVARCGWIAGMSPWLLYDFRSERRQNSQQRGFNRKGLIAADKRRKKRAFAVLRDFYRRWL